MPDRSRGRRGSRRPTDATHDPIDRVLAGPRGRAARRPPRPPPPGTRSPWQRPSPATPSSRWICGSAAYRPANGRPDRRSGRAEAGGAHAC
jgi:hypothetical protein